MARLISLLCASVLVAACDRSALPSPAAPTGTAPTPNATYSISGTVLDTGEAPVAGALVDVTDGTLPSRSALTDERGRFSLSNVLGGVQRVRVSKDGYFTSFDALFVNHDVDLVFALQPAPTLVLGQETTGTVNPGDPVCDPERYDGHAPCGRFVLVAPSNGTIEITLTWSDPGADLDLALMSPMDEYLAMSFGRNPQERVTARVQAGVKYEVRIFNAGRNFTLKAVMQG